MKYGRIVFGKWSKFHVSILEQCGIAVSEGYHMFEIEESPTYYIVKEKIKNAPEFSDRRSSITFDKSELEGSPYYMMHGLGLGPALSFPAWLSNREDIKDGGYFDYLRYAFGELCETCNYIPKYEQSNSITLKTEPKFPKKFLWGGFHGVSGYLFTDFE